MVRPNGLVGSPDGKTLYIADWGATNVFRYTINAERHPDEQNAVRPSEVRRHDARR